MSIAHRVETFLTSQGIPLDILEHPATHHSTETAQVSHIPGECLAKGILLKSAYGYVLAVLPSTRHIMFDTLSDFLRTPVDMASEDEAGQVFLDCEVGAIPPLGTPYGIDVIVDESLGDQSELWLEGGDHAKLLHVSQSDFERLTAGAQHTSFSRQLH